MTGRYKITLNAWRTWEPEKRTAKRWSLFINTCHLLANDSLNYDVTFSLDGDDPHILITASGTPLRKGKPNATPRHAMPQPLKADVCAVRAQEVEWFLPDKRERRNSHTTHWRHRGGRYAELNAMVEEQLRTELEYWREMELLSGQREHFKPGLTDETQWSDDEVAA
jgi:hypothetical protein